MFSLFIRPGLYIIYSANKSAALLNFKNMALPGPQLNVKPEFFQVGAFIPVFAPVKQILKIPGARAESRPLRADMALGGLR